MKRTKITSFITAVIMTVSVLASGGYQALASLYEEDFNSNQYVCIVKLSGDPLSKYKSAQEMGVDKFIFTDEGQAAFQSVKEEHETAKSYLSTLLGETQTPIYEYTAAYNGFAIPLTHKEYKLVKDDLDSMMIEDICEVAPYNQDADYEETADASVAASDQSYTYEDLTNKILETTGISQTEQNGDGIVIAVIDSAFDRFHEFFTMPDNATETLTQEDIVAVSPYLAATHKNGADYYVSRKIPYAFNYGTQTCNTISKQEYDEHGTHVAGIAAGNGDAETNTTYEAKGVAPDAQLVLMSSINFFSHTLLAAYDDCLYLGADVINASYGASGASCHSYWYLPAREAITNITNTGTAFCSAAGNSAKFTVFENNYLDYSTSGYPDNINGVMSVGSAENYFQEISMISVNDIKYPIIGTDYNSILEAFSGESMEYVPVPGSGDISDYEDVDVEGKIALVSRGQISFSEKAENAAAAGAVGIIIYNNIANDSLFAMECDALPSGFISLESGQELIDEENKIVTFENNKMVTLAVDDEVMSNFSAWDFTEELLLKPDITGFGGNVVSSVPDINGKKHNLYSIKSGTSMSTPQLTGINALLKQYLKENTDKYGITNNTDYNELMAKLLMSTATPIKTSDELETASPRVQGNGLANVANAIKTPCYLSTDSEVDNYRPKISLGEDKSGDYTLLFYVHNISDAPQTYQFSESVFTDDQTDDGSLSWNTTRLTKGTDYTVSFQDYDLGTEISEITVEPGTVRPVTAKITITQSAYDNIFEKFESGTFVDGFITLSSETQPDLTLSYMAFCGSWNENNKANIIENFAYKEPDNEYGAYLSDGINTAGLNLIEIMDHFEGIFDNIDLGNLMSTNSSGADSVSDSEEEIFTLSQPYFSPITDPNDTDKAYNTLFVHAYFKRRCNDVKVSVYNSKKELVYSESMGSAGTEINSIDGTLFESVFEVNFFEKCEYEIKNNDIYTVYVSAKAPLSNTYDSYSISQNFIIDTEKPTIDNCAKLVINGTEYLMINASDNGTLQGAVSYDKFQNAEDYAPSKDSILVKLPEDTSGSCVEVYDMAGNYETINVSDVTQITYLSIDGSPYFFSDEKSFKDRINFVDEDGNELKVSYDFSSTPAEVYENQESEVVLLIGGAETAVIPINVGLRGDANADRKLAAIDAAYIAKLIAKASVSGGNVTIGEYPYADYNMDGKITAYDAALIAKYLAEKALENMQN